MGRYDLPGPRCSHVIRRNRPRALVSSHAEYTDARLAEEAFASTWVCGREDCITDAIAWVYASTHKTAVVLRKGPGE